MLAIVGLVVIVVMVFGGYLLAGGKMYIIMKSLPYEFMMIGGASVGAFLVGNDGGVIKHTLHDLGLIVKGARWKKDHYQNLLCLLFELAKTARVTPLLIEQHIEAPEESAIFQRYPDIIKDKVALNLICDYFRVMSMNVDDPHQVEDILDRELERNMEENMHSAHALQTMSDGLPAIGIVAAVLGVIKTMGSIDQPPEVLGKMIGGALVGTFLGVFLSYCMVGPMASKIKGVHEQDQNYYNMIKDVLVSYLNKHQPATCIEIARKNIPSSFRPTFLEMDDALRNIKKDAA